MIRSLPEGIISNPKGFKEKVEASKTSSLDEKSNGFIEKKEGEVMQDFKEFEEYENVIKQFFKSSSFPLLRIARTKNTRFMRESWIEELQLDQSSRKQLDLTTTYLADDKVLDSFIDLYDKEVEKKESCKLNDVLIFLLDWLIH